MKNKILIFTATYNESENIQKFLLETNKLNNISTIILRIFRGNLVK